MFDQLFFNATEGNETEILINEVVITSTLPTTTTTVTTTTTTANSLLPKFPDLFALPAFPKLFGFGRSKWMPFGKHADYAPKLLRNPTWRVQCSPPVSWTYCYPECGSGDQALDSENAYENALADIFSAVSAAMEVLNLGFIQEDQVKIRFTAKNVLLEEFQDQYERKGDRYRVVRGSVRYYYNKEHSGMVIENIDELDISIHSSSALSESLWRSVANEIANYLTKEKYVVIKNPLKIVSYSAVQHNMFFF